MSKPLIPNVKRAVEAAKFHAAVFAKYAGPKRICEFCKKPGATDAAHIIPRSRLGPLRYAAVEFARPACRSCHEAQERGEIDFAISVRREAILIHNQLSKIRIEVP